MHYLKRKNLGDKTIFERKNDTRKLPFIDEGEMSLRAAILMLLIATVITIGFVYISADPFSYMPVFKKVKILAGIVDLLLPILVPAVFALFILLFFE